MEVYLVSRICLPVSYICSYLRICAGYHYEILYITVFFVYLLLLILIHVKLFADLRIYVLLFFIYLCLRQAPLSRIVAYIVTIIFYTWLLYLHFIG